MTPPPPNLLDVVSEVIYYLGLALPIGIGMTLSALAIPESRGGVVAARLRGIVVPAATLVALAGGWHFTRAAARAGALHLDTLGQLILFAITAAGLLAMRSSRSRTVPTGVMLAAVGAAVLPTLPHSLPALAHNGITIVHLLGALFWTGGLITLAIAGLLGRGRSDAADAAAQDWSQSRDSASSPCTPWARYSSAGSG